jgi:hypothetical protein
MSGAFVSLHHSAWQRRHGWRPTWLASVVALVVALMGGVAVARKASPTKAPPPLLRDTGLYADFSQRLVDPRHLEFSPQYPLWSDGAAKRRWISLPPGQAIDGANPDAWVFPVGTRFWKEFSFGGRRIETRYIERQRDGSWLYAAYAWSEDESEAHLVSEKGKPGACDLSGGRKHFIPSVIDCKACHQGHPSEVLGFGALQLSPDRDPNAVHGEPMPAPGVDLRYLVKNKLLKRFPRALLEKPPVISASTPIERTALGYLHGNCGHCHNDVGSLKNLEFALRHVMSDPPSAPERAMATAWGRKIRKEAPGQTPDTQLRIEPQHPERSLLMQRMGSRYALLQMPPLGTVILDEEAITLVSRWIAESGKLEAPPSISGSSSRTQ